MSLTKILFNFDVVVLLKFHLDNDDDNDNNDVNNNDNNPRHHQCGCFLSFTWGMQGWAGLGCRAIVG